MTPMKRHLLILLFLIIGVGFGIGFGAIFYLIRKKKDNEISMGESIKQIIIPSTFFWVTIGILIILKIEYCIPIQLFILSGIVLASFLSAISCKKAWMFFLGLGIVFVELCTVSLVKRITEWVNCRVDNLKAKRAAEKAAAAAYAVTNSVVNAAKTVNNIVNSPETSETSKPSEIDEEMASQKSASSN